MKTYFYISAFLGIVFSNQVSAQCSLGLTPACTGGSAIKAFEISLDDGTTQIDEAGQYCYTNPNYYELIPSSYGYAGGIQITMTIENNDLGGDAYFGIYFDLNGDCLFDDVEYDASGCAYINPFSPQSLQAYPGGLFVADQTSDYANIFIPETAYDQFGGNVAAIRIVCDDHQLTANAANDVATLIINDWPVPFNPNTFSGLTLQSISAIYPYASSDCVAPSTSNRVMQNIIIDMDNAPTGGCSVLEEIKGTYNGTISDITNVKIWSTGGVDTYDYNNGTPSSYSAINSSPSAGQGGISFTGLTMPMQEGLNHIWVTYDIYGSANTSNTTGFQFNTCSSCSGSSDHIKIDGQNYYNPGSGIGISQGGVQNRNIDALACTTYRLANSPKSTPLDLNQLNIDGNILFTPNPFSKEVQFEMQQFDFVEYSFEIRDALGRSVFVIRKSISQVKERINELETAMKDLVPGIYFIIVSGEKYQTVIKGIKM